jgi:ribonuclease H / adenosylcobalamin/alpha-ribazole phosphatase
MAAVYLARHGSHAVMDRVLVGRSDSVGLSQNGFEEARALAAQVADAEIARVQSSPRRRCRETAMIVATALAVPFSVEPALDEVDFGHWTGKSFAELESDERWRRWNGERAGVRAPGGETADEAQARILNHVLQAAGSAGQAIVMITHAELIRSVLLWRAGLGLDAWQSLAVACGSVVRVDGPVSGSYERVAS